MGRHTIQRKRVQWTFMQAERLARPGRRGYGLIGVLITVACVAVLLSIVATSLNKAVTGEGSAVDGTVRSFEDKTNLYALYQGLATYATENNNRLPRPSEIHQRGEVSMDTTANLFSALIAERYVAPKQLIAGNEYSPNVWVMEDYAYHAYDPAAGVYWDERFKADLDRLSHVSYAHMPLYGERLERTWRFTQRRGIPLFGNRGPEDGEHDPDSYSYGRSGQWGGHQLYGDGSIEFTHEFTPAGLTFRRDGEREPDNLFAFDDGEDGADAMLTFTRKITDWGIEVQFD